MCLCARVCVWVRVRVCRGSCICMDPDNTHSVCLPNYACIVHVQLGVSLYLGLFPGFVFVDIIATLYPDCCQCPGLRQPIIMLIAFEMARHGTDYGCLRLPGVKKYRYCHRLMSHVTVKSRALNTYLDVIIILMLGKPWELHMSNSLTDWLSYWVTGSLAEWLTD